MNSICTDCVKKDVCMFCDLITDNDIGDSPLEIICYARKTYEEMANDLKQL